MMWSYETQLETSLFVKLQCSNGVMTLEYINTENQHNVLIFEDEFKDILSVLTSET